MSEHNGRAVSGGEDRTQESDITDTEYSFLPVPGDAFPEPDPDPGPGPLSDVGPDLDLDEKPPAKRSRIALVTVTAATFAVTAGVLLGVSLYRTPSRADHIQDDLRESVPPQVSSSAEVSPGSPSPSESSPSPSASASESASESAATSPTASATASPTATPTVSPTTPGPDPTPGDGAEAPRVLRLGDTGPQVRELQLRLQQIGRYDGEVTGVYDESVQSAVRTYQFTRLILADDSGVYGAATRRSLESETREP